VSEFSNNNHFYINEMRRRIISLGLAATLFFTPPVQAFPAAVLEAGICLAEKAVTYEVSEYAQEKAIEYFINKYLFIHGAINGKYNHGR